MGDNGFSQQKWVHKELKPVVKRAVELGWTGKKTGNGGWTFTSPGKTERFYLPITADNRDTLAKTFDRQIDKALLTEGSDWHDGISNEDLIKVIDDVHGKGGKIHPGPNPTIECTLCHPSPEFSGWNAYAVHMDRSHPAPAHVEPPSEGVQEAGGVIVLDPVVEAPVEVVIPRPRPGFHAAEKAIAEARESTASDKMPDMEEAMQETLRPWRAIKERDEVAGTVLTYASPAVLEVVVDGKVTTHKCAVCTYRNDNPKSVVSHHSRHVSKGEVKPSTESDYRTESAEKYPLVISKGPYVHARDEQEGAMYEAIHGRHQGKTEADSVYARALVERLNSKGWTVGKLGEVGNPGDTYILNKIRDLLGMNSEDKQALTEALDALAAALAAVQEKEAERLEAVEKRNQLQGFVNTLAGFAKDEVTK